MKPFKRPESVLVVIYTPAGSVLLLRRRDPPDFWQSVTGSLEWGESPTEAAIREVREETGFEAIDLQDCGWRNRFPIIPPWTARYAPDVRENVEHEFRLLLLAPSQPKLNPAEHSEFLWLPATSAAARAGSWTNRDAILRATTPEGRVPETGSGGD